MTAVCSAKHEQFVRSIGADEFIDYQRQSFSRLGRSWSVIFDVAGTSSYWNARRALVADGRFVSTEPSLAGVCTGVATKLLSKQSSVMLARPRIDDLAELVGLYQAGQLRPTLAGVFPLDQAAEAHRRLESGGHCGKYVLRIDHQLRALFFDPDANDSREDG